jgi:hypothetical protein
MHVLVGENSSASQFNQELRGNNSFHGTRTRNPVGSLTIQQHREDFHVKSVTR